MNITIKKVYLSFLVTTMIAVGLVTDAYGGLIMEQIRYEKGSDQKEKGIIYVSNNKIKAIQEKGSGVVIFDLNTGEMIQVDNDNKRYVVAKPDEMRSALEVQISKLPPEQRAKLEEFMKSQSKPKKLTLKRTGIQEKIAGYTSQKYEIYEDGKLNQEIWASKEVIPNNELDPGKMASYIKELEKIKSAAGGDSNQDDEEMVFKQIYESGFPMRSVDYSSGSSVFVEEIVKVTTANVSETEFQAPGGYKKVTLQEMMSVE